MTEPTVFVVGNHYRWRHNHDPVLVYLGYNWSGNGYWHQFQKLGDPNKVWCEVTDKELSLIEEDKSTKL